MMGRTRGWTHPYGSTMSPRARVTMVGSGDADDARADIALALDQVESPLRRVRFAKIDATGTVIVLDADRDGATVVVLDERVELDT